jgi:hypothetical protein
MIIIELGVEEATMSLRLICNRKRSIYHSKAKTISRVLIIGTFDDNFNGGFSLCLSVKEWIQDGPWSSRDLNKLSHFGLGCKRKSKEL